MGVIEHEAEVAAEVMEVLENPADSTWHWGTAMRAAMVRNAGECDK